MVNLRPSALFFALVVLFSATSASAQAVGGADKARPVAGDPGISSMVVMDQAEFRVLRDYAEPGATRRMQHIPDPTWAPSILARIVEPETSTSRVYHVPADTVRDRLASTVTNTDPRA